MDGRLMNAVYNLHYIGDYIFGFPAVKSAFAFSPTRGLKLCCASYCAEPSYVDA